MDIRIVHLHLTLTNSQDREQGRSHIDSEYLENGDQWGNNYYCYKIASHVLDFDWHIYI